MRKNGSLRRLFYWVFPDEWGERSDPNKAYKQWRYFCREYDIRSTIHEMRHTYISILKNDMPEQMLKDLVGHGVDMDTYGVYGHVVNGEMERAKNHGQHVRESSERTARLLKIVECTKRHTRLQKMNRASQVTKAQMGAKVGASLFLKETTFVNSECFDTRRCDFNRFIPRNQGIITDLWINKIPILQNEELGLWWSQQDSNL